MAEVMAFSDLKELGSEANVKAVGPIMLHAPATARLLKADVKAAGKYRQEGKLYEDTGNRQPNQSDHAKPVQRCRSKTGT